MGVFPRWSDRRDSTRIVAEEERACLAGLSDKHDKWERSLIAWQDLWNVLLAEYSEPDTFHAQEPISAGEARWHLGYLAQAVANPSLSDEQIRRLAVADVLLDNPALVLDTKEAGVTNFELEIRRSLDNGTSEIIGQRLVADCLRISPYPLARDWFASGARFAPLVPHLAGCGEPSRVAATVTRRLGETSEDALQALLELLKLDVPSDFDRVVRASLPMLLVDYLKAWAPENSVPGCRVFL